MTSLFVVFVLMKLFLLGLYVLLLNCYVLLYNELEILLKLIGLYFHFAFQCNDINCCIIVCSVFVEVVFYNIYKLRTRENNLV